MEAPIRSLGKSLARILCLRKKDGSDLYKKREIAEI